MSAKLTIVIPVFNESRFLEETLNSALRQTINGIEILVGDNASTDDSAKLLQDFSSIHANVRWIKRPKNIGAVANVADLIQRCSSPYVAVIGAHDLLHPKWAEELTRALDQDLSVTLAYPRTAWIDERGVVFNETDGGSFVRNEKSPLDRITACISHEWGECTAVNGIFRASIFESFWFPKVNGPDHIILARASYLGRIKRIDSPLYLRREFSRESSYFKRIKGSSYWAPSDSFNATIASHFIDYFLLAGLKPSSLKEILRIQKSLREGYGRLGVRKSLVSFIQILFWMFYFALVISRNLFNNHRNKKCLQTRFS